MAKTRKNKSSNTNVDSSKEESKSVRSKIDSIEEGLAKFSKLGNITSSLQNMNANLMVNNDYAFQILRDHGIFLSRMSRNIETMTKAMLGMKITDNLGNTVEYEGMKIQGGSANMKEKDAEKKKEDEEDDKRFERIMDFTKMSSEELKKLNGVFKGGSLLDILLLGGAVLAGFVAGVVERIMTSFKSAMVIVDKFKKILGINTSIFTKIVDGISKGLAPFIKVFRGISDFIYKFSGMKAIMDVVTNNVTKVISFVVTSTKGFFTALKTFSETMTYFTGKAGMIGKLFDYFKSLFKVIGPIFNAAKSLGSTIFKVVPFIAAVVTIFDTLVGAFKGFTETEGTLVDKIIGALKGGITGFFNSIVGNLLDLLKDGVSWALNAMGFEGAAKALDSFSFKDIIKDAVNSIVEFFMTPVRVVQDIIAALNGEISWSDMFKSVMGRIVSAILTPIDFIAKKFGISITEKALELLGLPSANQGAAVSGTDSTGTPTKALEKTTDENLAVKDEAASKSSGATAIVTTNNSPVINNNSQSTAILKSKTTNWEPDDQWARGGGMAWGA